MDSVMSSFLDLRESKSPLFFSPSFTMQFIVPVFSNYSDFIIVSTDC